MVTTTFCVRCWCVIGKVLARLGSTLCADCRDGVTPWPEGSYHDEVRRIWRDKPGDGPCVTRLKALFRGDDLGGDPASARVRDDTASDAVSNLPGATDSGPPPRGDPFGRFYLGEDLVTEAVRASVCGIGVQASAQTIPFGRYGGNNSWTSINYEIARIIRKALKLRSMSAQKRTRARSGHSL